MINPVLSGAKRKEYALRHSHTATATHSLGCGTTNCKKNTCYVILAIHFALFLKFIKNDKIAAKIQYFFQYLK